jgi:branched-chain amino acid transport system ATP-binding protein
VSLLSVTDLTVDFGGLRALDRVSLEVGANQFVGLIGPNGAGKTTLIDAVSGYVRSTGRIRLGTTDLAGCKPHERARAGLGRTFQSVELFDDLSVEENLLVGAAAPIAHASGFTFGADASPAERVGAALERFGLAGMRGLRASELAHGQRRLVGIARALVAAPRLLLLDEPAAGLDSNESDQLAARLRELRGEGLSVLLVDHDMGVVLPVCDEVVVLDFGRVLARGRPEQVRTDARVLTAYLGGFTPDLPKGNGSHA